jgi:hypothetical protein
MPIRSLLAETRFNLEQTEMIAKAFDDAWAKVKIDEAEPAMASLVRTALAKRIIEMAHCPGVDVQSCGMTPLRMSKKPALAVTSEGPAMTQRRPLHRSASFARARFTIKLACD